MIARLIKPFVLSPLAQKGSAGTVPRAVVIVPLFQFP
nr:MAG TPA: hypothetical protein [Caudoviricetes sp.]